MKYIIYSPNLEQFAARGRGPHSGPRLTPDRGQAHIFDNPHIAWLAALELGKRLGHAMQILISLETVDPAEAAAKHAELLDGLTAAQEAK